MATSGNPPMQSIIVRHNVEMGHRLSRQPESKCYHLHGHSWWIELELFGRLDGKGMVAGLNFGEVKSRWRNYLDMKFDHKLCLNQNDPLCDLIIGAPHSDKSLFIEWGIQPISVDPTVENMALIWGEHAIDLFPNVTEFRVKVQESATNAATWWRRMPDHSLEGDGK